MLPGGGREAGETSEDCCVREIEEETGLLAEPLRHFLTINEYYEECRYITCYFVCRITGIGRTHLTEEEVRVRLRPEWLPFSAALEIFSRHADYAGTDEERRGLYLREYNALTEWARAAEKED